MRDFNGKINFRIGIFRLAVNCFFSSLLMSVKLKIKKVGVGNNVKFYGLAIFSRTADSFISVDDNTCFRSSPHSNLIGIKASCIVATHGPGAAIIIGQNCGFSGTVIGALKKISIGNDVLCGANTLITDFDWHGIAPDKRLNSLGESKEVIIGNNVFIGYGSTILKGVTIGENSVIGANSVVTKSIPANVIAGGNPCRVVRPL
ncbi:MAG: acyltransferase [Ferruginibacter sp.]|uniref:acyltransferase n=1 Tax=Ferruginibacter sp. TaxID=1940288 RepID=UPI0026599CAC|nr:acyltransferase [Ferruginibacter sp.]MDB5280394.1 acyltransferase [Ferruginibacter sp.]